VPAQIKAIIDRRKALKKDRADDLADITPSPEAE
jgi:hypothetical protein